VHKTIPKEKLATQIELNNKRKKPSSTEIPAPPGVSEADTCPVIPEKYKSMIPDNRQRRTIPKDTLEKLMRTYKAPRTVSILVQPDTFAVFDCYVNIMVLHNKQFFTCARAAMDTGAPCGGLIYAVDDPRALAIDGVWEESLQSYHLLEYASAEIAGNIYENITIVRHKAWSYANEGDREPIIGGHLLARLAVSFIGLEMSAESMAQLPDELQQAGLGAYKYNGNGEKQWIQRFLEAFPETADKSINYH